MNDSVKVSVKMAIRPILYLQVALGFITLAAAQSGQYGQCGGIGWTGATTCISGWTCIKQNDCMCLWSFDTLRLLKSP